jgi:hypothetical protein
MEDRQMKPWLIAVVAVVVIAVGAGGFFGGKAVGGGTPTAAEAVKALQSMTPQEMQQALSGVRANGGTGGTFGNRANGSGGFVSGSVISQDGDSITVKLADGSTKIVLVSGSTTINLSESGSMSDLAVGKDVSVTGSTNSDGSVTATRIQIGTLQGLGNGPPAGAGAGADGAATSTTVGQ